MIPIFRAKKIDGDEYLKGQLTKLYIPDIEIISEDEQSDIQRWAYFIVNDISMLDVGCSFTYCGENRFNFKVSEKSEIDPTTLAIHFPDMLDNQGNKIFASLSEDGKGGDMLSHCHKKGRKTTLKYLKDRFCFGGYTDMVTILQNNKVIGIQE